jgi:hypothetical protein
LLVAVMLPRERDQSPHAPAIASTPPASDAIAQAAELPAPVQPAGDLAREATARYASLARSTSDSLSGVLALWQPAASQPGEPGEAAVLSEMAEGLRPLADSTSGAVRFLLDVLPQGEPADENPTSIDPAASHRAT